VVEANRAFYADEAARYAEHRHSEAFLDRYKRMIDRDWQRIRPFLPATPRALDACSGTGLLTRLLVARGCDVTSVELSEEMLEISGCADGVCADIETYLAETDATFDLIAFGSALHHLYDYERVLELAVARLNPGGVVYLVAEPVLQATRAGKAIRQAELVWRKVRRNPRDVPAALRRRLAYHRSRATVASRGVPEAVTGFYAEVHAFGMDYEGILRALAELEVVFVDRSVTGGPVWRFVKRVVPGYDADGFNLAARR
jgi:SAM-dependent methyltransferase